MNETLVIEGTILLVLVATLVAVAVRRVRLPYTVSLVLVGLLISIWRPVAIQMTPETIMAIFIPPLIFEAALHLDFSLFRQNLVPIAMLAVPGVILTALLVGGIVALGVGLPLGAAVVFGALIAATDPLAVVSLFRSLGVPRRFTVAMEGESLFNDGTAIVLFHIAVAAAVTGVFDPFAGLLDFLRVGAGGLAIGLALGWVSAQIFSRIDDDLIVTTLTALLAYGAYFAAERLHLSGVLAVVATGLLCGTTGLPRVSPTTKIMLFNLWEFIGFLASSLVFLLIGLNVHLPQLSANLDKIAVALAAVLLSRALTVYGLSWLAHVVERRPTIPLRWRHILFWGGLRGPISLALALSLPIAMPQRDSLQAMVFGVILFTLLVQGTTIQFLLKRLGLSQPSSHRISHETRLGQLFATRAGLNRIEELRREGLLTNDMSAGLRAGYHQAQYGPGEDINSLFIEHADLEQEMLLQARREALRAERAALGEGLRRGLMSEDVYQELQSQIDYRLAALDLIEADSQEAQPTEQDF